MWLIRFIRYVWDTWHSIPMSLSSSISWVSDSEFPDIDYVIRWFDQNNRLVRLSDMDEDPEVRRYYNKLKMEEQQAIEKYGGEK